MDRVIYVGVELRDDAAGLGFDLHLCDWLDFAGGDDRARDVADVSGAELGGIDGRRSAEVFGSEEAATADNTDNDGENDPKTFA
jgi:hypothetical protein